MWLVDYLHKKKNNNNNYILKTIRDLKYINLSF